MAMSGETHAADGHMRDSFGDWRCYCNVCLNELVCCRAWKRNDRPPTAALQLLMQVPMYGHLPKSGWPHFQNTGSVP